MTLKEAREQFQVQGIDNEYLDKKAIEQEEAFKKCVSFLEGVDKTKLIRRSNGSYQLKHLVECAYRNTYVYEGTLILAALSMGFVCRYAHTRTMRCHFNMGVGSLKKRVAQFKENA